MPIIRILLLAGAAVAAAIGVASAQHAVAVEGSEVLRLYIADSEVRELRSEETKVAYKLYLRIPSGEPPPGGFAVVYLLDADYSFLLARNITDHLSERNHLQPLILVGIAYAGPLRYRENRTRDYTPTHVPDGGYGAEYQTHSGGGPAFARFLEEELIPFVERTYPVSGRRTLVGHSYGGLLASWLLLTRPGLFQGFVIVSPSLWYDDEMLFALESRLAKERSDLAATVYFGVGARERNNRWDMPELMQRFVRRLERHGYASLRLRSKVWEDETHHSIFPLALSTGLRFVHNGR